MDAGGTGAPIKGHVADPLGLGGGKQIEMVAPIGEVFRARDPLLDREVALKLRKPRSEGTGAGDRRAIEEGRRLARVRHPNVLTVHGADSDGGRVGLWTELIEGPNLYETVREHGQALLGWRDLEIDNAPIGETARAVEPVVRQIFIGRGKGIRDAATFERKLYIIRKVVQHRVRASDLPQRTYFHPASLSCPLTPWPG